jgi:hypothetical protein
MVDVALPWNLRLEPLSFLVADSERETRWDRFGKHPTLFDAPRVRCRDSCPSAPKANASAPGSNHACRSPCVRGIIGFRTVPFAWSFAVYDDFTHLPEQR